MNKKVIFGALALLVLVAVVLTAGCTSTDSARQTYVVGIDEYTPFSYTDVNTNEIVGFDIDCMKWIANEEGYDVTFEFIEWDALTTYLASDKRDIICSGLSVTDERAKYMAFSQPYWSTPMDAASLLGKDFTVDQIKRGELRIGVQAGCTAEQNLEKYLGSDLYNKMMSEGKIKNTYDKFPLAMEDLKNGRVDVVIFDSVGIKDQISKNPKIFKLVGTLEGAEEDLAAAVKIGNTELLDKINDGYTKLKATPYWDELVEKYKLNDRTEAED